MSTRRVDKVGGQSCKTWMIYLMVYDSAMDVEFPWFYHSNIIENLIMLFNQRELLYFIIHANGKIDEKKQ